MDIKVEKIPNCQLDRLARSFLRTANKMFENPKVQAEYAEWLAKRQGAAED